MKSKRKLKPFNTSKYHIRLLVLFALSLLFLQSGCSQKQWRNPLSEGEEKSASILLQSLVEQQKNCKASVDAEINATWKSRVSDGGFNGYLQILMPDNMKIVAINPLGQPLFAFSTNGRRFQAINVEGKLFKHGRVSTFVKKHSLPDNIFHDGWGRWLAGRIILDEVDQQPFLQDKEFRGFWLLHKPKQSVHLANEYLLISPTSRNLLERVGLDKDGNEIAKVVYTSWARINGCTLPTSMEIQSNSYGTSIEIDLKDVNTLKNLTIKDVTLRPPQGFLQQYYP